MKRNRLPLILFAVVLVDGGIALSVFRSHYLGGMWFVYASIVSLFFIMTLYGFVVSQTRYSHRIEEPKYTMLEAEVEEWR